MYRDFYGLIQKPFQSEFSTSFFWLGNQFNEAYSHFSHGIDTAKGLMLLTGDVGTGKTALAKFILANQPTSVKAALIHHTDLSDFDLLKGIAQHFIGEKEVANCSEFLLCFEPFLKISHQDQKTLLLIMDEAQNLSSSMLELLQHLCGLELDGHLLFTLLLVGQSSIHAKLALQQHQALRQRIAISHHLHSFTRKDTKEYVEFRLKAAGCQTRIFQEDALDRIFELSLGTPRTLNNLCDLALIQGYNAKEKSITASRVERCAEVMNLKTKLNPTPPEGKKQPIVIYIPRKTFLEKYAVWIAATFLLSLVITTAIIIIYR